MSNKLRAALRTAAMVFVVLFATASLGWFQDIAEWASSNGQAPLPGLSVLGYAAVSAATAAAVGLVNFVIVWGQEHGVVPGRVPDYTTALEADTYDEGGSVELSLMLIAWALCAMFIGLLIAAGLLLTLYLLAAVVGRCARAITRHRSDRHEPAYSEGVSA